MLTIREILFIIVLIVVITFTIFLLIISIKDYRERNKIIQQIKKRGKTFKISDEEYYTIRKWTYE
jgi:uncharacterized membrane protein